MNDMQANDYRVPGIVASMLQATPQSQMV